MKCPVCKSDVEDDLIKCPICGAHLQNDIIPASEEVETEVVDEMPNFNDLLQGITPQQQKLLIASRFSVSKKLIIGSALFCYTSPIAILLSTFAAYKIIYLLLNYRSYVELHHVIPQGTIPFISKKSLWKDFAFYIISFALSCGIAYYLWVWRKS